MAYIVAPLIAVITVLGTVAFMVAPTIFNVAHLLAK